MSSKQMFSMQQTLWIRWKLCKTIISQHHHWGHQIYIVNRVKYVSSDPQHSFKVSFFFFFSAWWDEKKHQCTVCFCTFQHFLSLSSFMILRSGLWPNFETLKGNSVKRLMYLYGSLYKSCLISLNNKKAHQCYLY